MGALIQLWAALITIISWLKRHCNNPLSKLSKRISLPVYVHLIYFIVVVVVSALTIIFWPATPATTDQPKELQTIKGKTFGRERVTLDGKLFTDCKFTETELLYMGEGSVVLLDNNYENIGLTFGGPAKSTMRILTALYANPIFRPKIEATFEAIKTGKFRAMPPPSDAADD